MSTTDAYDVAVIGYGPTGATAANLLGQLGLKVLVVERDPDVYGRARAISTDEEVMRVWQSVGLADRLQQDMLPDRPLNFVDADGVPFIDLKITSRGTGHPPQQFLYQPAVDHVLRDGVARFPNVEVLLEHECLRVLTKGDDAELLLADLRSDTFKRFRASYVIAADGGSSPTRGQSGIGYSGRTYTERWVVIDTKVRKVWDAHDRLRFHCNPARPTVDCPTPLGHHRWEFPARTDEDEQKLLRDEEIWKVLNDQGITSDHVEVLRAVIYSHHVRVADRWRVGRVFLAGDAAHAMPPWLGQGMSAGVRRRACTPGPRWASRRSASASPSSSAGCNARRPPPLSCGPTDSFTPQPNPGNRCPRLLPSSRCELEHLHDDHRRRRRVRIAARNERGPERGGVEA
jgi:3-(3-hydroxy-phenyl)propionate hydroxylase